MKVKGNVLLSRKAFVEKHFGLGAWDKVLEALPAEDRNVLRGLILSVGWFPFKLSERLDAAIVKVLGEGRPEVFEEMGRISAEENLKGAHRQFLTPGDPRSFMSQSGEIYKFYYDTGRRTYEPRGNCGGILTTHDADTFSQMDCLTVIGWYKKALEMCGAKTVRMKEETCRARGGDCCQYQVEWTV